MSAMDDILQKMGLTYDELTSSERATLDSWMKTLDSNQLDIDGVRKFVHQLKIGIEQELQDLHKETPQTFVTLLALFIPFYGLIKKWYQDEHRLFLEARLRNILLVEAFLTGPKIAREALNKAIAGMVSQRNTN